MLSAPAVINGNVSLIIELFCTQIKKHDCPDCGQLLVVNNVSEIVNSNSEKAKDFDFSCGDTCLAGNIKFIRTEFKCPACQRTYSPREIWRREMKSK